MPKYSKAEAALRFAMIAQTKGATIVPAMVGQPGTGKTATLRAIAKEMGYDVITLIASRMEPTDFSGFPGRESLTLASGETIDVTTFAPMDWEIRVLNNKKVILFLDEFSNANPSVQSALLTFIQDRQFPDGHALPVETVIVMAMNPIEESTNGFDIKDAMNNRILWINWVPDNREWLKKFATDFGNISENEASYWRSSIYRFLSEKTALINRQNDEEQFNDLAVYGGDDSNSNRTVLMNAWASMRTWDNLCKVLEASYEDLSTVNMDDPYHVGVLRTLVNGTVGSVAGEQYLTHLEKESRVSVKDIVANPSRYPVAFFRDRMDVTDIHTLSEYLAGCELNSVDDIRNVVSIVKKLDDAKRVSAIASSVNSILKNIGQATRRLDAAGKISAKEQAKLNDELKNTFQNALVYVAEANRAHNNPKFRVAGL